MCWESRLTVPVCIAIAPSGKGLQKGGREGGRLEEVRRSEAALEDLCLNVHVSYYSCRSAN